MTTPTPPPQALGVSDADIAPGIAAGIAVLPLGAVILARLFGASWKSAALLGGSVLVAEVAVATKAGSSLT